MTYPEFTGAPERADQTTEPLTTGSMRAPVQRRMYRYAGCAGFVLRWVITTDAVPRPYLTQAEALAELQRRRAEPRHLAERRQA